MLRLVVLVVLLATVCLERGHSVTTNNSSTSAAPSTHHVVATNSPTVHSTPTTRPTNSPTMSSPPVNPTKSSVVAPKTSLSTFIKPTPTPRPDPIFPSNYTYMLMDDANKNLTCLRMVVDVAVNLTYRTSPNTTDSMWVELVQDATTKDEIHTDSSVCYGDVYSPNATLVLKYVSPEIVNPYMVNFTFVASRKPGNQQWNSKGMGVGFTFVEDDFPNYVSPHRPKDNQALFSSTNQSIFDESFQRMELTRPFVCRANRTFSKFSSITEDNSLNVSIFIRQLQVQAFNFTNTDGNFTENGAARVCLLDSTNSGNTIVPIAVGAALALLVIIVIIAYLIGRVRNKRKSSYEPLN